MTAPASPPVTSTTATVAQLLAFITAHPTDGVYIYLDSGSVPGGAGIAASAVDTTLLAAYKVDARTVTYQKTQLNAFAKNAYKVKARLRTDVYNARIHTAAHYVTSLDEGTEFYVYTNGKHTFDRLWYTIASGSYVGDFVDANDVFIEFTEQAR